MPKILKRLKKKASILEVQRSILESPKFDFNDFLDILGRFLPS